MTRQVLLCEDECHILRAAELKLKRAGFDVVCTSDGQEGWEQIERETPDLVVTDCQMPRLDGISLIERLRTHEMTKHLPVIILSAKGYELNKVDLVERLGVSAVLPKPFSPRELLRCVDQILAAPTSTPTSAVALP